MAKILVVDDEEPNRRFAKGGLRGIHQVEEAANGREAQGRVNSEEEFDLILLDNTMPEMNGLEFLHWLRWSSSKPNIPVVVWSSDRDQSSVEEEVRKLYAFFCSKPIGVSILRDVVATALREKMPET